jgi:hypothetical protein
MKAGTKEKVLISFLRFLHTFLVLVPLVKANLITACRTLLGRSRWPNYAHDVDLTQPLSKKLSTYIWRKITRPVTCPVGPTRLKRTPPASSPTPTSLQQDVERGGEQRDWRSRHQLTQVIEPPTKPHRLHDPSPTITCAPPTPGARPDHARTRPVVPAGEPLRPPDPCRRNDYRQQLTLIYPSLCWGSIWLT